MTHLKRNVVNKRPVFEQKSAYNFWWQVVVEIVLNGNKWLTNITLHNTFSSKERIFLYLNLRVHAKVFDNGDWNFCLEFKQATRAGAKPTLYTIAKGADLIILKMRLFWGLILYTIPRGANLIIPKMRLFGDSLYYSKRCKFDNSKNEAFWGTLFVLF